MLCSLSGLFLIGKASHWQYLKTLSTITWHSASWNASFLGFFTRVLGGSENTPLLNLPWLAYPLTWGLSFLVVFLLIWVAWPRPQEPTYDRLDLGFSLAIVSMFLLSPLGWMYYFPLLLLPLMAGWRISQNSPRMHLARILLVFAWLLSTMPHFLIKAKEMDTLTNCFVWAGSYFYALLLFGGTLLGLARLLPTGCLTYEKPGRPLPSPFLNPEES